MRTRHAIFDTVRLRVRIVDPDRLVSLLYRENGRKLRRQNDWISGTIGHKKVAVNEDLMSVRGSILRDMLGTENTREAIRLVGEKWSEELGEDITQAYLNRIDTFVDLDVERSPSAYLPHLLSYPRFRRLPYSDGSIRFEGGRRALVFYDKVREMRHRKEQPPDGNRLRYEHRILKDVVGQIGRSIRFCELGIPDVRNLLIDKWEREYERVRKGRVALPFSTCADGIQSWKRGLMLAGARDVGHSVALASLRELYDADVVGKSTYYKHKRWLLELEDDPSLSRENHLVVELDSRVAEAAARMRLAS